VALQNDLRRPQATRGVTVLGAGTGCLEKATQRILHTRAERKLSIEEVPLDRTDAQRHGKRTIQVKFNERSRWCTSARATDTGEACIVLQQPA